MPLFQSGDFTLHSGGRSPFKIDCDALSSDDLCALAALVAKTIQFGMVEGVPRGGLRFAWILQNYLTDGPLLIVDDVLTTGTSMEEYRNDREAIGVVLFARGPCPKWVTPVFSLGEQLCD